jgi:hypothetical protein
MVDNLMHAAPRCAIAHHQCVQHHGPGADEPLRGMRTIRLISATPTPENGPKRHDGAAMNRLAENINDLRASALSFATLPSR